MRMRWKRTNPFKAAAATLGLWGCCTLGVAQTIPNPSFEANSFSNWPGYISTNTQITGWTSGDTNRAGLNPVSGSADHKPFADNGVVPDGTNVAFIQCTNSLSTIISNLTVGQTYKVNFRVNARYNFGGTPNLNVWIGASNIINSTVTPVAPAGVTNIPYKYFAFDFTAAATNQTMTLSNDASGDQTVLLDNFSSAPRNIGWSYAAWTNDASSGVIFNPTNYTHAYNFGTNSNATINGVTFTGITNGNPSNGVFSTTGLPNVVNNDVNNLTSGGGGSAVLANAFLWGGTNESITLNGLLVGNSYLATIYSVGFDATGARAATFIVGNDRLTVNQDQFGNNNGILVSYAYTANAKSLTLTYVPLSGSTFHTYGFSNARITNAHAAFLIVTNLADSGPGSLRQVISNASPGETITFDPALSGQTNVLTGGELLIPYNLTLDASALPGGFKISANHNSRVFEVAASVAVTLNSLTIQDGQPVTSPGGGIYVNSGANLTLTNCTLSGNSGIGIYNPGGTVTINGSTFSGNSDGGIYNGGTLTINGSTFSGNSATGGGAEGGGIYNPGGTVTINGSTFSGNSTSGGGGGIFNDGNLALNNSTFSGNSASSGGGGIFSIGTVTINGSTFSGNSANGGGAATGGGGICNNGGTLRINNSTFSSNSASGDDGGGGIFSVGTLTINGSTFSSNSASGGANGGGILVYVSAGLTNCTLSGNSANNGGGIANFSTLTLTNCAVTGNSATNNGGGVYTTNSGTVTVRSSNISSNSAANNGGGLLSRYNSTAYVADSTFYGNSATNNSGGIENNTSTLTLTNCTLSGNSATFGGGLHNMNTGMVTLINCTLSSNRAGGDGGAIHNVTRSAAILNGCTVSGNSATNAGGGIENEGSLLAISNSVLSGNSAPNGGGIRDITGSTNQISNTTLSGNSATNNGGGIVNDASTLTLNNSTLYGNSANFGGALYNVNTNAVATLVNDTLFGNSAGSGATGGGGIFQNASCALTNTIVAGNTAAGVTNNISGSFTGANNLTNGDPLLAPLGNYGGPTQTMPPLTGSPAVDAGNDSVTSFVATDQRGLPRKIGVHVDIGAAEYFSLPFVTTTADAGGGSLRDAAEYATNGATVTFTNTLSGQTILLTNGQLTLNQNVTIDASSLPAGITVSGNHSNRIFEVSAGTTVTLGSLTLTNGNANGNVGSGGIGGAILVDSGGTLTLNNSTLSGNSANGSNGGGGGGGGIYNNGALTLNNSTLSGNSAKGSNGGGGGIFNSGTLTLNNSTLSGNSASATNNLGGGGSGGGIYFTSGDLTLNNSTLSGNSAVVYGGGIYARGPFQLTNTIVAGNSASGDSNIFSNYGVSGMNNLVDVNPLLALLGNYGGPTQTMPPVSGSPAIDAGADSVTNFLATDQRGFPRKVGAHVDIGAVEYFSRPFVTTTADAGGGSLRDAAVFATNGATITFTNTLSGQTIVLTNGQITLINNNVTVDASSLHPGITVSANHSSRIFEVSAGATATLDSLTLINGNAYSGGAILVDSGGTLGVYGCQVSSNSAAYAGGIANNGTLTLSNSVVAGNSASALTGGVENDAGNLTIIGSLIFSNTASSGGGVASYFTNALTTISDSTLSGNFATNNGGAILNAAGTTMLLTNSTLSGNSAGGGGGGIRCEATGTLTLNNSTLSGNSAVVGGGIDNFGLLTANQCSFAFNSATNNNGGAIEGRAASTNILRNCTIFGNTAAGLGGGVRMLSALDLENCVVATNGAAMGSPDISTNQQAAFLAALNNLVGDGTGSGLTNGISGNLVGTAFSPFDPLLAPLGNYGGPTQTMPPLAGSPAIDAGNDSVTSFLATDQRGFPRKVGAHVDIGAVEAQFVTAPTNPPVLKNAVWTSAGGTNTFQFSFTNVPDADFTALASTNVSLPLTNWTVLGNIQQISSGQYQFTDSGTNKFPRRFYRVVSP